MDLRKVELRQLEPLLREEIAEWEETLHWDFSVNADQVRRHAAPRMLPGAALLDGGEVAGYGYTVLDFPKGLIGDIYVRRRWRGGDAEVRLYKLLLDELTATEGIARVESQPMLISPAAVAPLLRERFVQAYERRLLSRRVSGAGPAAHSADDGRYRFAQWDSGAMDSLPRLIVNTYEGHVDSLINDQFRSEEGAGTFLKALTGNDGSGDFYPPGSILAIDRHTGWIAGAVLTSIVSPGTAHVTQLCVVPGAQGQGLGCQLLRRCMAALEKSGIRRLTLSVTGSNARAVRMYDEAGFTELRRFCAVVWDAPTRMSNSNFG